MEVAQIQLKTEIKTRTLSLPLHPSAKNRNMVG